MDEVLRLGSVRPGVQSDGWDDSSVYFDRGTKHLRNGRIRPTSTAKAGLSIWDETRSWEKLLLVRK